MSELNLNAANLSQPKEAKFEAQAETGGSIASNSPSPLFSVAPTSETGGSNASNGSSSSSGVGVSYTC